MPFDLLDRLDTWSMSLSLSPALVYLADGEREQERLDYRSLSDRVSSLATWIRERIAPGERVLLAPHSEVHYLVGLLACLRAEVVAVPALTPGNERSLARVQMLGEDAGACAMLVDPWVLARRERFKGSSLAWINRIPWLDLEDLRLRGNAPEVTSPSIERPERLAYLQYTSGSTSNPKGVIVTRANLASQLGGLERVLGHQQGVVVCNWMPFHHDFGLIMSLQALYSGGTVVLLPAVPTVQRPRRWLQAITSYRAMTSAAPNFMFSRCVERISAPELQGLDLSSLRNVMNGAEPIQPAAVRSFSEHFSKCGFRESAWVPAYGLAEATLTVSVGSSKSGCRIEAFDPGALLDLKVVTAQRGKELVGCGTPLVEDSIAIIEPESGLPCPNRTIGEIWVNSPSVTAGYWLRDDETMDTFRAIIRDQSDERRYLRTGDLGFMWEGELFIAGRHKDLIIVRGENHYPQDIEFTMSQSHPDLEPNAGAAFAIDGSSGELLVVVQEVRREAQRRMVPSEVFAAIRHAIAEGHGLDPARITLLRPGGLPRTSSGKVQRRACRQAWQENRLPILSDWNAGEPKPGSPADDRDPLTLEVMAICGRILGIPRIDPHVSLFEYGVDSLKAVEILLALDENLKASLDLAEFAENSSIVQLARAIREGRAVTGRADRGDTFYLGDRDERDSPERSDVVSRVSRYVAKWEGDRTGPENLLVGRNTDGARSPIYWVFQGQSEFLTLADHLGPTQPVYGMRSGNEVMEYTEANVQALATSYRREITTLQPHGPYLLGGNCQGGLIALAIAQQFWRLQQPVALLCLLEWAFPPQPYLGRVALLWGKASTQKNPFFKFRNPEFYWRRAFGSYSVDLVSGGHGEFFSGANVEDLARRLSVRLEEAIAEPQLLLPADAIRATYRPLNAPTQVAPGENLSIKVEIRNLSLHAWASTDRSGLQIGNHWRDDEGGVVSWLDGIAPMPVVAPGGTVVVDLQVCCPLKPGNYLLQFDMVEEAVTWFSERGVVVPAVPMRVSNSKVD